MGINRNDGKSISLLCLKILFTVHLGYPCGKACQSFTCERRRTVLLCGTNCNSLHCDAQKNNVDRRKFLWSSPYLSSATPRHLSYLFMFCTLKLSLSSFCRHRCSLFSFARICFRFQAPNSQIDHANGTVQTLSPPIFTHSPHDPLHGSPIHSLRSKLFYPRSSPQPQPRNKRHDVSSKPCTLSQLRTASSDGYKTR